MPETDGRSLWPILTGGADPDRADETFREHLGGVDAVPSRMAAKKAQEDEQRVFEAEKERIKNELDKTYRENAEGAAQQAEASRLQMMQKQSRCG